MVADTVPPLVMAEQITHDVVKQAQSMGGSPIDDPATTTKVSAGDGDAPAGTNSTPSNEPPIPSMNAQSTDTAQVSGAEAPGQDAAGASEEASSTKPDTQEQPDANNQDPKEQLVNGDAGEQSATDDALSQQALGETSGGSDTDISRPGSVDQAKGRPGRHLRSNSVKKPASFKSVSVTKNFLAKSAVSTPAARVGEKAAPVGQVNNSALQNARPRLVAKSGTGVGNLQRSSISKINGAGSGPDASKVWNKNQPVAPPPPKQFTDEELKQQYGIHLATRLQADESGKEAKWADIDDDEDDWTPDTVQWMDGTKSTVAAVENEPPPPEEPKPAPQEIATEAPKATSTPSANAPRPSSTSGTKTILKPGAHAQAGTATTKTSLSLKGQPEKPTLVAKPSAPNAVKSPWAQLPPVEKVPPVQINPPLQQAPASRYAQRDAHGYDSFSAPSQPAKEIAPDDFNRSWRDDRGNRELFNSHSGRYEPVHETRRGSVRDNFRQQPSVLQRPSQDGPAEPSAAFQTSRTSAETPAWGRRRNSSNVSGGSGRRVSIDRPHMPLNTPRRGSQSINGAEAAAPGTPRPHFSQKAIHPEAIQPVPEQPSTLIQKTSPNMSHAQPTPPLESVDTSGNQDAAPQGALAQTESAVEVQNRLMREKLERARLAKQKEREREEKEEAERKERLRKKLEAMGLTDDAKSKAAKEQSPSRAVEKSPGKDKAVPAPVQSPPKPPVPTSQGEVAQYGMMKVHQPQPVKKSQHSDATAVKSFARGAEPAPKPSPSPVKAQTAEVQPRPTPPFTSPLPLNNSNLNTRDDTVNSALSAPSEHSQPQALQSGVEARTASQGFKPTAPQAAWSPAPSLPQQPRPWTSNVWGPPQAAKDKALGNGTFDSSYNSRQGRPSQQLPPQTQPVQSSAVGSTLPLKPSPSQTKAVPTLPFAQQTIHGHKETMAPPQAKPAAGQANSTHPPGPIAPPATKPSPWDNWAATIRDDDIAVALKARRDGARHNETFKPDFRETFHQHKPQEDLHQRTGGKIGLTNGKVNAIAPPTTLPKDIKAKDEPSKSGFASTASVNQTVPSHSHTQLPSQTGRSSRFFPRHQENVQHGATAGSSISDSPPPPETETHPAFSGDTHHPIVKMPKPSPRVRLPPSVTEPAVQTDAPVSMPSRARLSIGARPLALDPEWQARFNSLLDKSSPTATSMPGTKGPSPIQPPTHAKAGSLAVAAASKAPLDVRANISATVSLPNVVVRKPFVEDDSNEMVTRTSAEGILLEEREFGSLPVVKLSKVPHLAANEPVVGLPIVRPHLRSQRAPEVISKTVLPMPDFGGDTTDVVVRLANMKDSITKILKKQYRRTPSNSKSKRSFPSGNGPAGSNQNQNQNQRGARKPSNYQGQNSSSTNSNRQSSGGNGWSNNRSTPPRGNGNNGWAQRVAGAIVH